MYVAYLRSVDLQANSL